MGTPQVQVLGLAVLPHGPYYPVDHTILRSRRSYGIVDRKRFREKFTMQAPRILKIGFVIHSGD